MKAGTHNHLKTKRLKRLLGVPLFQAVGILETLWLLCTDCCDEGNVGKFTNEEIADYFEWDGEPDALINGLVGAGWIDQVEGPDRLMVHDWHEHAPDFIKDRLRMRRARETKQNLRKQTTYVSSEPNTDEQERTNGEHAGTCHVSTQSIQSNPIQSQPSPSSSGRPNKPELDGSKIDWQKVLETANDFAIRLGIKPNYPDARPLVQLAWLLHSGEPINGAVNNAIDATRMQRPPPDDPVGYMVTIAGRNAGSNWKRLRQKAPDRRNCPNLDGTFDG